MVWSPSNPLQMVSSTDNIVHPLDLQIPLPDILLRAIAAVVQLGPQQVAKKRAEHCSRILQRIRSREKEEKEPHSKLNPQVGAVLKGKNILIEGSLNSKLPTIWRVEKQMKSR